MRKGILILSVLALAACTDTDGARRTAESHHPMNGKVMVKDDDLFWLGMDYHYGMVQWLATRDLA